METEAPAKLDVKKVVVAAFVAPLFHRRIVLLFALPVLALHLAAGFFDRDPIRVTPFGLLGIPAMLLLSVACHRIFILGPAAAKRGGLGSWAMRMARFLGWMIVIGVLAALAAIPAFVFMALNEAFDPAATSWQTDSLIYLLFLPALYVMGRLSLVFPAAATEDTPADAGKAWKLSAGNGLRLMLVVALLPGLLELTFRYLPEVDSIVFDAVVALAWVYVLVVQVAALSMAYRELSAGFATGARAA